MTTLTSHSLRPQTLALASALAWISIVAGCQKSAEPVLPSQSKPAPVLRSVETYKLVGVVRFSDPKTGQITIKHEAIPGFMGAMTMPFTLKKASELEDVRPGDEVEGTLRVEKDGNEVKDYELFGLVVTREAPPQGLTLKLSGGTPALESTPQSLRPGDLVPDFAMTDQNGQAHRLSDFRGDVLAVTFIYTRCPLPEFCPRMDRKFSDLADRLARVSGRAEHLRLLSVSIDPEHDTPAVLKAHAESRGATAPLWTFAVASHAELEKVARPLGLIYGPGKNEVIHNLVLALIGPDGRLSRLETGDAARSWEPVEIVKSMYSLMPDKKK